MNINYDCGYDFVFYFDWCLYSFWWFWECCYIDCLCQVKGFL